MLSAGAYSTMSCLFNIWLRLNQFVSILPVWPYLALLGPIWPAFAWLGPVWPNSPLIGLDWLKIMFMIVYLCLPYAAMHKFCAC